MRDIMQLVEAFTIVREIYAPTEVTLDSFGNRKTILLWENPTRAQLNKILSLHGEARAFADLSGNVWAWDAHDATHDAVEGYLATHELYNNDEGDDEDGAEWFEPTDSNLIAFIISSDQRKPDGIDVYCTHQEALGFRMVRRMLGRR